MISWKPDNLKSWKQENLKSRKDENLKSVIHEKKNTRKPEIGLTPVENTFNNTGEIQKTVKEQSVKDNSLTAS